MRIKKFLEQIYKTNVLAPSVFAVISSLSVYYYYIQRFVVWHPIILIGALPLYWFYRCIKLSKDKIIILLSLIYSFLFSTIFMLSAGLYLESPVLYVGKIKLVIVFVGLLIMSFYIFNIFLSQLQRVNFVEKVSKSGRKIFFLSWGLIAFSWIPYLVAFFPAIMTSDSIDQWLQATGRSGLFNHHPVVHTLLIRFTVFFDNGYPLAYSIFQMLFLSLSMSLITWWLYEKGLKKKWIYVVIIYFALHPLNAMYSITIWKDVIFSVFTGLLTLVIAEILISRGKSGDSYWWLLALMLTSLGVLFFRNNGIYVVLPTALLIGIVTEKNRARVILTLFVSLMIYFVITGPVFSAYHIKKSSLTESLGIPIQQVARTVVNNGHISNEDKILISKVMPLPSIKKNYTIAGVDPLKFNKEFHIEIIDKNKPVFFQLWIRLLRDNPKVYIAAYLDATRGFWDPLTKNWSLAFDIDPNAYGLKQSRPFPSYSYYLEKIVDVLCWKTPFYLFWSAASLNYLMLVFAGFLILKRQYKYFTALSPVYLNWLTLFLATPIATSTRYVYSSFIVLPIVLFVCIQVISQKDVDGS